MDLILAVVVFLLISLPLIAIAKRCETANCTYYTTFCRDVRTQLGMIACKSKIEEMRNRLNRHGSKF